MLDHFDSDMNSKAGSSCADFLGAFFLYIFFMGFQFICISYSTTHTQAVFYFNSIQPS